LVVFTAGPELPSTRPEQASDERLKLAFYRNTTVDLEIDLELCPHRRAETVEELTELLSVGQNQFAG
jgi:hypothetical protein